MQTQAGQEELEYEDIENLDNIENLNEVLASPDKDNPSEGLEENEEAEVLDEVTREILGEDPAAGEPKQEAISPFLVSRWKCWIRQGLKAEEKDKLLGKYPRKGECPLEAPRLNQEVSLSLTEAARKRDNHFEASQNQLGAAMVALGLATSMLLNAAADGIDRNIFSTTPQ